MRKTQTVTNDDGPTADGDSAETDGAPPESAQSDFEHGNDDNSRGLESHEPATGHDDSPDAESDDPTSLRAGDIAWPVPMATMWPLSALLAGLMTWAFGVDWVLVSVVPFVLFLAVMIVIDLRELRIPDTLTRPAAILALPLLALSLLTEMSDVSLLRAVLGALAMGGFYLLLFVIYPPGMGFGDVKLAPIIGAQLGFFSWFAVIRGLVLAYLIVGPFAILLLIFGRARLKTGFPFGPFMAIGAVVALVLEGRGF